MKLIRCFALFLAVWALWLGVPAGVDAKPVTSRHATTASAPAATQPAVELNVIRDKAFEHLRAGEFRQGLALLESLPDAAPDESVAEARALTADYLKSRAQAEAGRRAELSVARERVRLARLAKDFRAKLVQSGLEEKLYDGLEAVADAVQAASGMLKVFPTTAPADMQKSATEHIQRAQKELAAVRKLLGGEHGKWGKAFSQSADELQRGLVAQGQAWDGAALPADWRKLKLAEEKVQDALIDLGVLVARDPIMVALGHARDAKELSVDGEKFLEQPWVRELIREAQQYGAELAEQGKWVDALSVYGRGALSSLDEDNLAYKEMLKRIARHVHVLSLYGRNGSEAPPATQPTGEQPDPATQLADEPRWAEMTVGIDTAMVRNLISRVGESYVDRPDFRKLGIAALAGIEILVQTDDAAKSLTALRQEKARSKFLAGLEKLIDQLRNAPTVDHLDVTLALNSVHELSDNTLKLPSEVIDKEFAESMLAELDQFSYTIWPYDVAEFNKRTRGSFTGIGVQIRKQAGEPIEVVTPLADTPAFRVGIRAGDYILKVNGRATRTIALERAVRLITGPLGTKVRLTIRRPGLSKPFDVDIVRDMIRIQTVKGWRRLPSGKWDYFLDQQRRIGYVRITQFTQKTPVELRQAIAALGAAGVKGLILDLRFNPGGLLQPAVEATDEFLRRELMIVRTKGRSVPSIERQATAAGEYERGELVVLVNEFSASAAEIAAGALKECGRATVIGTRTYGKGSVQRVFRIQPDGQGELRLTSAYYYLASGRCLHRTNGAKVWGVDPDLPVPVTFRQMNRWAGLRRETDLLKAIDPELLAELLTQQLREDLELRTALLLLRLRLVAAQT